VSFAFGWQKIPIFQGSRVGGMTKTENGNPQLYREVEHTGDFGIEVTAPTRPELFRRSALALGTLLVEQSSVDSGSCRAFEISASDDVDLMHDLLTELLQLFAADGFIWREATVEEQGRTLYVALKGESFDASRHRPLTEIKAVTYHQMVVEKAAGQWRTRIIFDI
jgi:SHS2 domain-containing protein